MNASDGLSDRMIASPQFAPQRLVDLASPAEVLGVNPTGSLVPSEFGEGPEIVDQSSSPQTALQNAERAIIFTEIALFAELLQDAMQLGRPATATANDTSGTQTREGASSSNDSYASPPRAPIETHGGTTKPSDPPDEANSSTHHSSSPGDADSFKHQSRPPGDQDSSKHQSPPPGDADSSKHQSPPAGDTQSAGGKSTGSFDGTTSSSPTSPSNNSAVPEYADTGIVRGKTIFRDDFNGASGMHPDPSVFDTAHITPGGQTRQRGANIDEDAIVSSNNSVLDGKGDLQLFPVKQKTYDSVAKQYVDYTTGSMNTGKGLTFNLKDYPNGIAIEVRAKHPTAPGAKFDALWLTTNDWAADPKKGQKEGDTVEYDAAEGGGADITVHDPTVGANGADVDHVVGSAKPKDVNFDDGQFHTYTVVIKPNAKTGRGDVEEFVDGKKEFAQDNVFPGDSPIQLRSSLEISPKWTHQTYTGNGGMNSTGAGEIDYLDVSELAPGQKVGT